MFKLLAIPLLILAHSSDTEFHDWFMSLKQPNAPTVSCCGPADQFYADDFRMNNENGTTFEALVNGSWIVIPENKIDWGRNNPTGKHVIFLAAAEIEKPFVFCFVPANSM